MFRVSCTSVQVVYSDPDGSIVSFATPVIQPSSLFGHSLSLREAVLTFSSTDSADFSFMPFFNAQVIAFYPFFTLDRSSEDSYSSVSSNDVDSPKEGKIPTWCYLVGLLEVSSFLSSSLVLE